MNQILIIPNESKKYILFFRIVLIFSILMIIGCISYLYISNYFSNSYNENLLSSYQIGRLYTNDTITVALPNTPQIIGTLTISKININYPIISELNDELLEKSICKFYGANPNEVGNLCIAGHNYNNNSFFSRLDKLKVGDVITIQDNSSRIVEYAIYKKYETEFTDTSCTSQDTFGKKEITLVTCNNVNGNRIIVKAREKK